MNPDYLTISEGENMLIKHIVLIFASMFIMMGCPSSTERAIDIISNDVVIDDTAVLFPIEINQLFGYINIHGEIVLQPQYQGAGKLSEGLASVQFDERKWGYINSKGDIAIEFANYAGMDIAEGLAVLTSLSNISPKAVIIDKYGNIISKNDYDMLLPYSNGLALFKAENGEMGYINKLGNIEIDPVYGFAYPFNNGLAKVRIDGKWGYIGTDGEIRLDPVYSSAESFKEGLAAVNNPLTDDSNIVFIDINGNVVIDRNILMSRGFSQGYAKYGEETEGPNRILFGYIDKNGDNVIPVIYLDGQDYSEGLAGVRVGDNAQVSGKPNSGDIYIEGEFAGVYYEKVGKWGFIDKKGEYVIEPIYEYVYPFEDGLAYVISSEEEGYINTDGEYVWKKKTRTKL